MSEATPPFQPQDSSEAIESLAMSSDPVWEQPLPRPAEATDWADAWAEPTASAGGSSMAPPFIDPSLSSHPIFDASTLDTSPFEDLPQLEQPQPEQPQLEQPQSNATVINSPVNSPATSPAPEEFGSPLTEAVSTNLSSIAAWSQDTVDVSELPDVTELITLIQELNQCNGVLMDRVSRLEEDLERSQTALQAEVGRVQDIRTLPLPGDQDWASVQEQITTLFNQLEFAHQTNQRQQILIETLTGQLDNGQERVAQLERESALLQQHYNEQTQLLSKSENSCRDLQARLQRQQRYTLQFKAALEKCLEVPTPQYETGTLNPEISEAPTPAPFLPKAQRIQPWSAHTQIAALKSPWMKLQNTELPQEPSEVPLQPVAPAEIALAPAAELDTTVHSHARPAPSPHLPSFGLPLLQVESELDASSADPNFVDPALVEEQVHRLTSDPALRQQLDAAVKPLADMLAEALLAEQSSTSEWLEVAEEPTRTSPVVTSGLTADALLASTMADAEDALWQDLARLIDVSTEDVVKASLSGDLAAFEAIDFAALPSSSEPVPDANSKPSRTPPITHPLNGAGVNSSGVNSSGVNSSGVNSAGTSSAAEIAPLLRRLNTTATEATAPSAHPPQESVQPTPSQQAQGLIPSLTSPSWPSPIVYPLRSTKKRQSLAMVDLPTFPKGEA